MTFSIRCRNGIRGGDARDGAGDLTGLIGLCFLAFFGRGLLSLSDVFDLNAAPVPFGAGLATLLCPSGATMKLSARRGGSLTHIGCGPGRILVSWLLFPLATIALSFGGLPEGVGRRSSWARVSANMFGFCLHRLSN